MVPAPALPAWPPPTNPTAPGARPAPSGTAGYTFPPAGAPLDGPRPSNAPPSNAPPASAPLFNTRPASAPPASAPPFSSRPASGIPAGDARPASGIPAGDAQPGTVYGGHLDGPGFATVYLPNEVETSGSLTGHILAQGWTDTPASKSGTTKAVIVLAAALGILVTISLLVVVFANDAIGEFFGNLAVG